MDDVISRSRDLDESARCGGGRINLDAPGEKKGFCHSGGVPGKTVWALWARDRQYVGRDNIENQYPTGRLTELFLLQTLLLLSYFRIRMQLLPRLPGESDPISFSVFAFALVPKRIAGGAPGSLPRAAMRLRCCRQAGGMSTRGV